MNDNCCMKIPKVVLLSGIFTSQSSEIQLELWKTEQLEQGAQELGKVSLFTWISDVMEPSVLQLDKPELSGNKSAFSRPNLILSSSRFLATPAAPPWCDSLWPGDLINQLFLIRIITRDFLSKEMNLTLCFWNCKEQEELGAGNSLGDLQCSSSRKEGFAVSLLFIP